LIALPAHLTLLRSAACLVSPGGTLLDVALPSHFATVLRGKSA